ncbi:hypothetical protein KIPB_002798 [Kipferlia bialata]|uniref:Pyruvate, water dikinase n=1 Tax=Kipferlia bialata TaxID=797122 RepID=A0A9K3CR95_9EUKA|nr:hypothetical protein KIPB_002798 [Kipferlia bialata]|eukprot:g2798.t1
MCIYKSVIVDTAVGATVRQAISAQESDSVSSSLALEKHIRQVVGSAPLTDEFVTAVTTYASELCASQEGVLLAVRSSSVDEDGVEDAFAGLHDTVLGVPADSVDDILTAIKTVWASLFSARATSYREQKCSDCEPKDNSVGQDAIAVVVQVMPRHIATAGVSFSADPVTNSRCVVRVESVHGIGEALVSGRCDADLHLLETSDIQHLVGGPGLGGQIDTPGVPKYHLKTREIKAKQLMIIPERDAEGPRPVVQGEEEDGQENLVREIDLVGTDKGEEPTLSVDEALRIATVSCRIATRQGSPQDIEFCMAKGPDGNDRELYILQSRPITSLFDAPRITFSPVPSSMMHPTQAVRRELMDIVATGKTPDHTVQHILVNFGPLQNMSDPITPLGGASFMSALRGLDTGTGVDRFPSTLQDDQFNLWCDVSGMLTHNRLLRSTLLMMDIGAASDPQVDAALAAAQQSPLWKRYKPRGKNGKIDKTHSFFLAAPLRRLWGIVRSIRRVRNNKDMLQDTLEESLAAARPIGANYLCHVEECRVAQVEALLPEASLSDRLRVAFEASLDSASAVADDVGPLICKMACKKRVTPLFEAIGADPALLVMAMDHNPTAEMNRDIASLAVEAVRCNTLNPTLVPLLLQTPWVREATGTPDIFLEARQTVEFVESLQTEYPEFHASIKRVMQTWMHRGPCEFDIGRPRLNEDPTSILTTVVGMLKRVQTHCEEGEADWAWTDLPPEAVAILKQGETDFASHQSQCIDAMERISASLSGRKRAKFHRDCAILRECGGCREVPKNVIMRHIVEISLMAEEAVQGCMDKGIYEDVDLETETVRGLASMCTFREVIAMAEALDSGPSPDLARVPTLGTLRDRLARYLDVMETKPPVRRVITTLDGCVHDGALGRGANVPEGALPGLGVSSGRVRGTARVIKKLSDAHRLQKGDILVAPFSDPGWTSVFSLASAIVLEVGGNLTHGSVVARELGLPGVVSVAAACTQIKDGDTVVVDGTLGYVQIEREEREVSV